MTFNAVAGQTFGWPGPAITDTTWTDTGLADGEKAIYHVRAISQSDEGVESLETNNASAVTTLPEPTNLQIGDVTATVLTLNWQDNANVDDRYRVLMQTGGSGDFVALPGSGDIPGAGEGNTVSYNVTGLTPGQLYAFQVQAVTDAQTSLPVQVSAVAGMPQNLSATADMQQLAVHLSWQGLSDDVESYHVYRSDASGSNFVDIGATAGTSFDDTLNLEENTPYIYRVTAAIGGVESASSGEVLVTTAILPPAVPTALTVGHATSTQLRLQWQDNSGNETSFSIERSSTGTDGWTVIGTRAANTTTFVDAGLSPRTTYYYRVRAVNDGGGSDYGNVASATTLRAFPTEPSGLGGQVISATQIDFTWNDDSVDADGYHLLISPDATIGDNDDYIYSFGTSTASYSAGWLTGGTTYTIELWAYNSAGVSPIDGPITLTTTQVIPAAPGNLSATPFDYAVNLAWSDNSLNEDNFEVAKWKDGETEPDSGTTVPADVTKYAVGGLTPETAYHFKVCAVNSAGGSDWSYASATTIADPTKLPDDQGEWDSTGEHVTVPTDGTTNTSGFSLEDGVRYQLKGTGTFVIGGPDTPEGRADTAYAYSDRPDNPVPGYFTTVNGGNPGWGAYNDDHVYYGYMTGSGSPIEVGYADWPYTDNSGSLGLEVFERPYDIRYPEPVVTISATKPTTTEPNVGESQFDPNDWGQFTFSRTDARKVITVFFCAGRFGRHERLRSDQPTSVIMEQNQTSVTLDIKAVGDYLVKSRGCRPVATRRRGLHRRQFNGDGDDQRSSQCSGGPVDRFEQRREHTQADDGIEDDADKPGKIIAVNDDDTDGDGVADFAEFGANHGRDVYADDGDDSAGRVDR